jgi:Brp/Blh family beta-carotene 15,15'-monooxygenase
MLRPLLLLLALGIHCATGHWSAAWPWVVGLVIAGMAHGAYDISIIRRRSMSRSRRWLVILEYAGIMGAGLALLWAAPALTIVVFLALAAHHFGVSDHPAMRGRIDLTLHEHLMGFCYGILVLGASFAFQPSAAWAPFETIVSWAGGMPDSVPAAEPTSGFASVVMLLAAATLAVRTDQHPSNRLEEWFVIASATLLGAIADPLFAIGSYFLVVHASGHCLRADLPGRPAGASGLANAMRVHVESLWWWLPSVAVVVGFTLRMFGKVTAEGLAISFIAFCIVATAPHHLIWLGARLPGMRRDREDASDFLRGVRR